MSYTLSRGIFKNESVDRLASTNNVRTLKRSWHHHPHLKAVALLGILHAGYHDIKCCQLLMILSTDTWRLSVHRELLSSLNSEFVELQRQWQSQDDQGFSLPVRYLRLASDHASCTANPGKRVNLASRLLVPCMSLLFLSSKQICNILVECDASRILPHLCHQTFLRGTECKSCDRGYHQP